MANRDRFFAPPLEPNDEPVEEAYYPDLPWLVPANVAGPIVVIEQTLAYTGDTGIRLTSMRPLARGIEWVLDWWVRPGTTHLSRQPHTHYFDGPKFGVLLPDGTPLGADPDRWSPDAADDVAPAGLVMCGGDGGELRGSGVYWQYPLPSGTSLEVVVEWVSRGIEETFTTVDLTTMRDRLDDVETLWPMPPPPEGDAGWFPNL